MCAYIVTTAELSVSAALAVINLNSPIAKKVTSKVSLQDETVQNLPVPHIISGDILPTERSPVEQCNLSIQ